MILWSCGPSICHVLWLGCYLWSVLYVLLCHWWSELVVVMLWLLSLLVIISYGFPICLYGWAHVVNCYVFSLTVSAFGFLIGWALFVLVSFLSTFGAPFELGWFRTVRCFVT